MYLYAISIRVGYFTLTTPFGLEQISKCRQQGFHPHFKEPPIYEVHRNQSDFLAVDVTYFAYYIMHFQESSHVKKDPSYAVIIVDLRK